MRDAMEDDGRGGRTKEGRNERDGWEGAKRRKGGGGGIALLVKNTRPPPKKR